jgi:hypothetical protein
MYSAGEEVVKPEEGLILIELATVVSGEDETN